MSREVTEPHATWETERLVLRAATRADAPLAFASHTADPEVPRYMTRRPHKALAEAEEFLRRCEYVWEARSASPWSLWLKAFGSLVQWALAQPEIFRVWAVCDVDNVASARS
jgi:RimJ/RimL family protein N-acetyltransferase